MIKNKNGRLSVELLEDRCVPTANSVLLQGGILNIAVNPLRAHTVIVDRPTAGTTQVSLDNTLYSFDTPVTQVNYKGGEAGDKFTNLTSLSGTLTFGAGADIVFSKAANQFISVGGGDNFVQDQAGGSTIMAGNGNNNIYGGPNDTITIGNGSNIVYSILGPATVNVAPHFTRNFIFVSAAGVVNGASADDRVAVFFAANRTPGAGSLVLDNGTLYFTANNNGNQFTLNQVGNRIVATYNLNDGAGLHTQVFAKADVKLLANFGGAGNDTFINNTSVPDVQYGAGGNNLLIGGFGALNLEKAGGAAGTSIAIGRSPVYNDLNGSGNANITTTLIVNPFAGQNVIRTNNPADQVYGFINGRDVFISPFQIKGKRTFNLLPPNPTPQEPPPPSGPSGPPIV